MSCMAWHVHGGSLAHGKRQDRSVSRVGRRMSRFADGSRYPGSPLSILYSVSSLYRLDVSFVLSNAVTVKYVTH